MGLQNLLPLYNNAAANFNLCPMEEKGRKWQKRSDKCVGMCLWTSVCGGKNRTLYKSVDFQLSIFKQRIVPKQQLQT